jgi:hypothetical protein
VTEWEDDTREGEVMYDAIVRPATPDEVAPLQERQQARAARDEARAALARMSDAARVQHHDTQPPREDGGVRHDLDASGRTAHYVTVYADGRAVWYHGGYYDDYRSSWGVTTDGPEVARLARLAE